MSARTLRALGSRVAVATTGAVALVLGSTQVASAAVDGAVESSVPFTVAGPVGIAAVIVGVGGFAVGLVRRRKATKAPAPAVTPLKVPAPRRAHQADNRA
ncbi:hypothetical protein [Actinokineospora diospyrosa]|uniref:Secreted protein with PEP-CTERM sorting signal n=1 Tax=Actinokineospora diospyrosa TaxID=103728 RepID=A0ABT1IIE6_9PSEU|nr:hypothetical protein [Actinokineospora diospyrosa]MCP2272412.1 hypothetical protein [Actinokineospora diospyrosa]